MSVSDSELERRFITADGKGILERASPFIKLLKLCNEVAFQRYQNADAQDKSIQDIFVMTPLENLATASIGENLSGEWFCRVKLGRNVKIGNNANLLAHGAITLGDNVTLGNNVTATTIGHFRHPAQRSVIFNSPINIQEGAKIEDGVILCAKQGGMLTIGRNAVVKAGAIVTASVPDNAMVAGRPTKRLMSEIAVSDHAKGTMDETLYKISTRASAAELAGPNACVTVPIYIKGARHLVADNNWKLFNRNCELDLAGPMRLGKNSLLAPSVSVTVEEGGSLDIEKRVWIGTGADIHVKAGQKLTIGAGSIVACGAEITEDVRPNTVVVRQNEVKRCITDNDLDPSIPMLWTNPHFRRWTSLDIPQIKKTLDETLTPRDLRTMLVEGLSGLEAKYGSFAPGLA